MPMQAQQIRATGPELRNVQRERRTVSDSYLPTYTTRWFVIEVVGYLVLLIAAVGLAIWYGKKPK